jgi:phosphoglycerol transferase MdoB-like AlkP superfamily enzyme
LAAVLLSIPPVQGLPYLGGGLEVARVHRAGSTLLRHGYRTIGAQSGPRRSYRTDGIAAALGFEEYAGMEDEPRRQKVAAKRPLPPFGWDYDVLMHLLVMLDAKTGPFLAFAITGTPHTPYRVPDERFEKYPHADRGLNGFLNALFYSDWAVGEFMNEARKRPWFNDTVFIFTADHALDASNRGSNPDARFGIPLLIFAPRLFAPRVDETVSSQADIWPTIVDLLGFEDSYAGIGRSLLRDAPGRFALMSEGSNVIIVTPNGWMRHSRQRRLETVLLPGAAEDEADRLEKLALSLDQAVFSLLKGNRFFDE